MFSGIYAAVMSQQQREPLLMPNYMLSGCWYIVRETVEKVPVHFYFKNGTKVIKGARAILLRSDASSLQRHTRT